MPLFRPTTDTVSGKLEQIVGAFLQLCNPTANGSSEVTGLFPFFGACIFMSPVAAPDHEIFIKVSHHDIPINQNLPMDNCSVIISSSKDNTNTASN